MKLKVLDAELTICQVADAADIDLKAGLCFIGKTDEELSLVCETKAAPARTLARSDGWRAFRIEGVLDFSLVGILARISAILAARNIGIFAVSTFNTDYILVKKEDLDRALEALEKEGYGIN